jgi:sporulation protein YlmC with PRC-barrel domain
MRCDTFCFAVLLIAGTMLAGAAAGEDQQAQAQDKQAQARQAPQAKTDSPQGNAAGGATREAPVAGAVPLGLTIEQKMVLLKGWRASKLIGASVYNDQNKRVGKIEDMIVSPDGKVSVAVIDVGGFLGIGKHRVAISVDDFADIRAKKLVLPGATKEALKELPEFRYA